MAAILIKIRHNDVIDVANDKQSFITKPDILSDTFSTLLLTV